MKHALSLSFTIRPRDTTNTYAHYQPWFFDKYLNRFEKLTSLRLASVCLDFNITKDSPPGIKVLTLEGCHVQVSAFVTLVRSLPELVHLKLIEVRYHGYVRQNNPAPRFSQSLRKLSVARPSWICFEILGMLFPVPWDKVSVSWGEIVGSTQGFIDRVSANATSLHLQENMARTYRDASYNPAMGTLKKKSTIDLRHHLSLSKCQKLRKLKICGNKPHEYEIDTIGTIESMEIQKIIFTQSRALCLPASDSYWTKLDQFLCALVNRPECSGQLEVEFRVVDFHQGYGVMRGNYLPDFRRCNRAEVKFVDAEGEIIHFRGKQ